MAGAQELLESIGRKRPTDSLTLVGPPDERAVQVALRTAYQHRLDRFGVGRLVFRVCRLRHGHGRAHAFANGLVRLYETRETPFNAALFAGALASVVRDHESPTASDLLAACEHEARCYPGVRAVRGDGVLVGTRAGAYGELEVDAAVLEVGTGVATTGPDGRVWATVEDVDAEEGVVVGADGSVVGLETATVERTAYDRVEWLAHPLR